VNFASTIATKTCIKSCSKNFANGPSKLDLLPKPQNLLPIGKTYELPEKKQKKQEESGHHNFQDFSAKNFRPKF
ncbi:hypothetical protein, partial [Hymenobacter algoricola]|uniref:hypothetical protein n=1 Tax=Hymenobacter algoricola TaxID=486267 RepID=UPI0031EA9147